MHEQKEEEGGVDSMTVDASAQRLTVPLYMGYAFRAVNEEETKNQRRVSDHTGCAPRSPTPVRPPFL